MMHQDCIGLDVIVNGHRRYRGGRSLEKNGDELKRKRIKESLGIDTVSLMSC